jgi:pectinesterase
MPWIKVATEMPEGWYGSKESIQVAQNVLLYQRNVGGWPKNIEKHKSLTDSDRLKILAQKNAPDATFDNDATTTEMIFLAKMYRNVRDSAYKDSFNKGLKFILEAQYKNGGWPMFYPLRKGYYTHITFNDNAIVNILRVLKAINERVPVYAGITDTSLVQGVENAYKKGVEIILLTQIVDKGDPTVWCAQHDEKTLLPAAARSYELPSFSGGESAGIVSFLMDMNNPSPRIIRSVLCAVEWFDKHRLRNTRWDYFTNSVGKKDRRIVRDPNGGDLWARFYDLETEQPFVCGRDGIKKKTVEEISYERRMGYEWYTKVPQEVLDKYPSWRVQWVK